MSEHDLAPISEADLAEHWFSLRNKTWRAVTAAVRASGLEQNKLAQRIGMDPTQFNKIVTGKKSNLTLRTLHNLARAVNHRLDISLVPLASLAKPNYSYDGARFRLDAQATSGVVATEQPKFRSIVGATAKQLEPELPA